MAYTTPKTWTTDEVVTATHLNTYIRDNQNALKSPPATMWSGAASDAPSSTSFVDVDATNMSRSITPTGDTIMIFYAGHLDFSGTDGNIALDIYNDTDGVYLSGGSADGLVQGLGSAHTNMSFAYRVTGLTPGQAYTFSLRFKELTTNGALLYSRLFALVEVT